MEDLLKTLIKNIVDDEDNITIVKEVEDDIIRFNVTLSEGDYPKIIGKRGLTIKALTDILKLYEAKNNPEQRTRIFINAMS